MSLARQFRMMGAPETQASTKAPTNAQRSGAKRGPKASGSAKVLLTLRLKPETIAKFKAIGKGWQTRISDILDRAEP